MTALVIVLAGMKVAAPVLILFAIMLIMPSTPSTPSAARRET